MSRDKLAEALLDALKLALGSPGEQRLYKSGKLDGLFPSRAAVNGDAAAFALREGLLEVVRMETRGKSSFEWVRLTPRGVEYLHDHESPLRVLADLRDLLKTNGAALPGWVEQMRQSLNELAGGLQRQAREWKDKLDALGRRVEEALARMEKRRPALPDEVLTRVPWATTALNYLDHRKESGATSECTLPELFEAVSMASRELSVSDFHDGLRHLQERRALRLLPVEEAAECARPEFALFDGERVFYRAAG